MATPNLTQVKNLNPLRSSRDAQKLNVTTTPPLYDRMFTSKPTVDSPFNREYLNRLSEGDSDTSSHFVRYFTKLLLIQLRLKFKSSSQAEDVTQETLYRVLQLLKTGGVIEHPERLPGFVRKVSDNVSKEYFRQGCRFQQVPENTPEPVAKAITAEMHCITLERKEMILRGLKQLNQKDRIVLEKLFFEEQDKDSICSELQIDRNYLRVQAHRALARFRKVLSASFAISDPPLSKKVSAG